MNEVNNANLSLTIFGCFRYSLGRMTYMPSHVYTMVTAYENVFNTQDWKRFIQEIDDCDNLGMSCDKETWNNLKDFCNEKLSLSEKGKVGK